MRPFPRVSGDAVSQLPGLGNRLLANKTCFALKVHRVHVDTESGATVVSGEGELDAFAAPELSAIFDGMEARRVVVDLNTVSFMDSTALGLVVRAVRVLSERGGQVRVVLPRTAARRIFEITTLDGTLPVSASRQEALEELAAEG